MARVAVEDRGFATPCHVWQGSTNGNGYGTRRVGRRVVLAHRYAYEEAHGPIPDELPLDHLCRVRRCVNLEHLEPVTNAENVRRGSRCRLTPDDVVAIRERRRGGERPCDLAREFGVHPSWITRIASGRSANRLGPVSAWALA